MENSYSKVRATKAFGILNYIGEGGLEGRSFSEIQWYIVTRNGLKWDERSPVYPYAPGLRTHPEQTARKYRGYYCTNLMGGPHYHQGLLNTYCVKLPNGRWILTEQIWTRENLCVKHRDPRSNTKTWRFNDALKRGKFEMWRDERGDPGRGWKV
jgi:hypothetical protein